MKKCFAKAILVARRRTVAPYVVEHHFSASSAFSGSWHPQQQTKTGTDGDANRNTYGA